MSDASDEIPDHGEPSPELRQQQLETEKIRAETALIKAKSKAEPWRSVMALAIAFCAGVLACSVITSLGS